MCCKCCSVLQKKIWVFGTGILLLILALTLGLVWPNASINLINSQLVLSEGSTSYGIWTEPPIDMFFEAYFFDWQNPEDIEKPDCKPIFKERGPYVFLEKHIRVNVTWHENNTVTFRQIRNWYFDAEKSIGSLDDEITFPDPITATVAHVLRNEMPIAKRFGNYLINAKGGAMNRTQTVDKVLFQGYDDNLLTFLKKLNIESIQIPFDKFGWFAERNGSATKDGIFNMFTGADDINKLGIVNLWNHRNRTDFYEDECGIVNGTTGELWPPNLNTSQHVSVFSPDVCRSINLKNSGSYIKHGVVGGKWVADDRALDNGEKYPEMTCFCKTEDNTTEPCSAERSGVSDVSECQFGAPVFVSYPHFYLAHSSYVDDVVGLQPDEDKHQFVMALEPQTGVPIEINARMQINIMLKPIEGIDLYEKIPKSVLMPLFWFRQKAELTPDLAELVKLIHLVPSLGLYIAYGLAAAGALIIFIGIIITLTKSWNGKGQDDNDEKNTIL